MYADWAIELGRDDPALELPWCSEDGACRYLDIRSNPSLIDQIAEATAYPALRTFLLRLNAPDFDFQTAKCDLWLTQTIEPEEEIFNATWKLGSYVDIFYVRPEFRVDLNRHESFARRLSSLLSRAPDCNASAEVIVRRCYYRAMSSVPVGSVESDRKPDRPTGHQAGPGAPKQIDIAANFNDFPASDDPMALEQRTRLNRDPVSLNAVDAEQPADNQLAADAQVSDAQPPGDFVAAEYPTGDYVVDRPAKKKLAAGDQIRHKCDSRRELIKRTEHVARTEKLLKTAGCSTRSHVSSTAEFEESVGFFLTLYVNGFGQTSSEAAHHWSTANNLVKHVLGQALRADR